MQEPLDVGRADSTIPRFLFYGGVMRLLTTVRGWQTFLYSKMKRKIAIIFCALICLLSSCSTNWEYKIVTVNGEETKDSSPKTIKISDEDLNIFGKDGWELVGVYTNTETAYPNFGHAESVLGIKENVRTGFVSFVFKRKK